MFKNKKIREYLINLVLREIERQKEIDEASTTGTAGTYPGGPGHYFTPYAFSGGRKKDKKKKKKITHAGGYKPVNEKMRPAVKKLLKQKGYGPIFQAIDNSKRQFKQMKYSRGEIQDTLIDMFGKEDPKILQKINEVTTKELNQLQKVIDSALQLRKEYLKVANTGDKELKNRKYNKHYETILKAEKAMKSLLQVFKNKQMLGEGRYHDWRNDESLTPKQKIGKSIREVRDSLNELDKTIKMNLKLKNELKVDSRDYWKNTHKALGKISERLVKLAGKVGNLK